MVNRAKSKGDYAYGSKLVETHLYPHELSRDSRVLAMPSAPTIGCTSGSDVEGFSLFACTDECSLAAASRSGANQPFSLKGGGPCSWRPVAISQRRFRRSKARRTLIEGDFPQQHHGWYAGISFLSSIPQNATPHPRNGRFNDDGHGSRMAWRRAGRRGRAKQRRRRVMTPTTGGRVRATPGVKLCNCAAPSLARNHCRIRRLPSRRPASSPPPPTSRSSTYYMRLCGFTSGTCPGREPCPATLSRLPELFRSSRAYERLPQTCGQAR